MAIDNMLTVFRSCSPIHMTMEVTLPITKIPNIGKCAAPATHSSICTIYPSSHLGFSPKAGEEDDDDQWWQDIAQQLLDDDFVADEPVRNLDGHAGHSSGPMLEVNWVKMVEVNLHGEKINSFEMIDCALMDGHTFEVPLAARMLVDTKPLEAQMAHLSAVMIMQYGGMTARGLEWTSTMGLRNAITKGPVSVAIEADQMFFQADRWIGDYMQIRSVGPVAANRAFCPAEAEPTPDYVGMLMAWLTNIMGGYGCNGGVC